MRFALGDFTGGSSIVHIKVRDRDDNWLGNLYLTHKRIIWCRGKTQRQNGKAISWSRFLGQFGTALPKRLTPGEKAVRTKKGSARARKAWVTRRSKTNAKLGTSTNG